MPIIRVPIKEGTRITLSTPPHAEKKIDEMMARWADENMPGEG